MQVISNIPLKKLTHASIHKGTPAISGMLNTIVWRKTEPKNRWAKLGQKILWDELAKGYHRKMRPTEAYQQRILG